MVEYMMQGLYGFNFLLRKWHGHSDDDDDHTGVQVLSQAHYDALMEQVILLASTTIICATCKSRL